MKFFLRKTTILFLFSSHLVAGVDLDSSSDDSKTQSIANEFEIKTSEPYDREEHVYRGGRPQLKSGQFVTYFKKEELAKLR